MKYYVKLSLITLLVSVAAAEIFGPLVGMRGYIGPAVMSLFSGGDESTENTVQLELANSDSNTSANTGSLTTPAAAKLMSADDAQDSCVSALKSVSLYPEFAQLPLVSPEASNGIYTFDWTDAIPISVLGASGKEQNQTATCRIGEDGRFRTLIVAGREIYSNAVGSGSVVGGWRIDRAISKADRSTNVTVSTKSTTPVVINGEELSPTLVLHCGENKTVSYVKLGTEVGSGKVTATSTVDGVETQLAWSISADGKNIYQGSRYITLLRRLAASSSYTLSFAPQGQKVVTLDFNLDGLKAAIFPLQEACHWR